jgi:hypothetical protein
LIRQARLQWDGAFALVAAAAGIAITPAMDNASAARTENLLMNWTSSPARQLLLLALVFRDFRAGR